MRYVAGTALGVLPRDRWVCIEMHIAVSTMPNGAIELFVDGNPAGSASGFVTSPAGGYTSFGVGFTYSEPGQEAATVYVDEVVFDRTRVGCD